MSADNTIVILHCKDGFRVGHLQAAENLGYYQDIGGSELDQYLTRAFGLSEVYPDIHEAYGAAMKMEDEAGYVEYGIVTVNLGDHPFPKPTARATHFPDRFDDSNPSGWYWQDYRGGYKESKWHGPFNSAEDAEKSIVDSGFTVA